MWEVGSPGALASDSQQRVQHLSDGAASGTKFRKIHGIVRARVSATFCQQSNLDWNSLSYERKTRKDSLTYMKTLRLYGLIGLSAYISSLIRREAWWELHGGKEVLMVLSSGSITAPESLKTCKVGVQGLAKQEASEIQVAI